MFFAFDKYDDDDSGGLNYDEFIVAAKQIGVEVSHPSAHFSGVLSRVRVRNPPSSRLPDSAVLARPCALFVFFAYARDLLAFLLSPFTAARRI